MEQQNNFVNFIINQKKYTRTVSPIQRKYVEYKNIKEWLVPYITSFKEIDINLLVKNMKEIIKKEELLRCTLSKNNSNSVMMNIYEYKEDIPIPVYTLDETESLDDMILNLSLDLKSREIINNILYNIAFIKKDKKIYFVGIFNHIIFDGGYNFKDNLLHGPTRTKKAINYYISYVNNLDGSNYQNFFKYSDIKEKIYKEYKVTNNKSLSFTYSTNKLLKQRYLSIEEFWYLVIYNSLFRFFPKYHDIPLCLLVGGRTFDGVIYARDFGDYHDEIMLVKNKSSTNDDKLEEFRFYKKNPYKNAKEYAEFLKNERVPLSSIENMEPIVLVINGKSKDGDEQIEYKKLLPRDKKHFLSIKVLCHPSFINFDVSFLFTDELLDNIENLKLIIYEEAEKLIRKISANDKLYI
ncbi:hypothetical protein [Neobacillus sp.]|uniref:hypothetical protein n=1 Tax=Neobacillus sp. TaxID=2675273 RepID=UPI0035B4FEDF